MNKIPLSLAGAIALALGSSAALATPPSTSAYATDVGNVYVHDVTSDGMANLNKVLCVIKGMGAADMLTQHGVVDGAGKTGVQYNALVDMTKCDNQALTSATNSASGSSGAGAATNYMSAVVDVSRGSATIDPMIAKIWLHFAERGRQVTVYAYTSATASPDTAPPYGTMRMDYAGYANSVAQFNGFIDANGPTVTHVETGSNSSNVALAINAPSTSSGSGIIQAQDQSSPGGALLTYTFAYSDSAFARNAGGGGADMCFDRARANAKASVWSYGTYDATSGDRVDLAHPGFPIVGTAGAGLAGITAGSTAYGYAGYWGVNFGNIDQTMLAALPDGEITAVTNILDQRPNNSTSYRLYKASGKLTRWSQNQTTLGALNGIPFSFFSEGCQLANGTPAFGPGLHPSPSGASDCSDPMGGPGHGQDFQTWLMAWDSALVVTRAGVPLTGNFKIVGLQSCQMNGGCIATTLTDGGGAPSPVPVVQGFQLMPIGGWADGLGDLSIPGPAGNAIGGSSNAYHADADPAYYYTQATVYPSSTPLALYCLSNCPTAASLAAYGAGTSPSPFDALTAMQWGTGSAEVAYTYGAAGLADATSSAVLMPADATQGGQNGVMSGRLYATDLVNVVTNSVPSCPMNGAYCEPRLASDYYTYQTGLNQWNQTTWLTAAGSPVTFDPPQNIQFVVPQGADYGTWAGKTLQLQFSGFGNLSGIPGNCVDPLSNAVLASCTPNSRFVPSFALPDGTALTRGSQSLLTKALNAELRLAEMSCASAALSTSGVSVAVPTSLPHDPSAAGDPTYLGTPPTVTAPPAVIDGVLQ